MEVIKMIKKPRLKNPYLIVAWPGMGEVAFKAATYLADKLKAEEFAQIPPEEFFYLMESVVKAGVLSLPEAPQSKFYYWKNKAGENDLIIFISDSQPDLVKAEEYSRRIIQVARTFKVKMVVSFAAMPQAIDHNQQPNVWFSSTNNEINNNLKPYNLHPLSEGQVSGMNGLFLGIAKREGFNGFCLLGEIPLYTIQIENPRASYAVLEALSRILKIQIDFHDLNEQTSFIENQINSLLEYLKLGPSTPGPISEDEIEKIKKSLSQLTKLPISIKEKIEKLFVQANGDIAKAQELKIILDKWNAYKEYEDRFLDLFKKNKDKNN
ncbi:MAG: PAC2 family protein [Candidatus Omnitrophota bacterium]|nr:PAC2 family protein [Candidatus Omnitrophota bacterium]MBU1928298.1 PAC2 family protein [Candidatus Omnitrophota bacterium]MBU2035546.1 PAC2 family protein [Candidatus Omnitrophota bacterium]